MYAEYGLGTSTPQTRRMAAEMMYGTRVERQAAAPADRPLSAMVAERAMPVAHAMDAEAADMSAVPVGAAQGLGELIAEHAEMTLGGQEG